MPSVFPGLYHRSSRLASACKVAPTGAGRGYCAAALDAGACRLAQAASPGHTVLPVLPAGLTFVAARVFLVP